MKFTTSSLASVVPGQATTRKEGAHFWNSLRQFSIVELGATTRKGQRLWFLKIVETIAMIWIVFPANEPHSSNAAYPTPSHPPRLRWSACTIGNIANYRLKKKEFGNTSFPPVGSQTFCPLGSIRVALSFQVYVRIVLE